MKKSKTLQIATVAAVASLLFCGAVAQAADMGWNGKAEAPRYQEQVFPPWQHGGNNPAIQKGLEFTVPEVDDLADFHGSIDNPQLTIFVGGNYYFAMAPLVKAFEKEHPDIRGKIYYETLPPGILIKQMKQGGTITIGNMTWTVKPDVYAAGLKKVNAFIKEGLLQGPAVPYVTNDLTIMVPKGNPAHITGLQDLGKPGVRLSMPNPAWEGVARQIKMSLTKAGGPALEKMVYDTKVKNGETILTHIHHRQTPLFLMQGLADAGVTWKSEAIFQEQAGHPIANVAIPAKDNTTAIYASAVVKGAAHPKWARDWVNFLKSPTALQIFEHYGFKPYTGK
ncbi:MAG: substrate-binding domain-containing protein [Gammaproteobacteria bacterium]|nr:substrate-binding domain-containing protein [Gammaproteobacteria bacterium]